MKTRKLALVCATTILASMVVSAVAPSPVKAKKARLTPEERMAKLEADMAADGGMLVRPAKGKVVRVLLRTKKLTMKSALAEAINMSMASRLYIEVVESEEQSKNKTGCLITIADLGKAPTLLVAPEEYWATVNVSRLEEDSPSPEVLKSRIVKEWWRALGYALGAANSTQYTCVMRPISSVADLDAEKISVMSPQPLMSVIKAASKLGFARGGLTSYRKACEEGWAPQPTNELQKTIWSEVHAIPDQPLKIKKQK